jgi:hypothetical protein
VTLVCARDTRDHLCPDERAPAPAAVTAPGGQARPGARVIIALAGIREPIVVILFLIAFFTSISGKPLDGLLLFIVATGLAWDAALRYRGRVTAEGAAAARAHSVRPNASDSAGSAVSGSAGAGGTAAAPDSQAVTLTRQPRAAARTGRGWLLLLAGLAGGVGYAAIVGSFSRYSWPATVGVIALGAAVVAVSWRGPLRRRRDPGPLPPAGATLWAGLLVAGGLWELVSLLQQPDLTTASYAHPTISALTDPLLGSHAGRSVALGVWLAIGWFLAER